jgi:hypothetical protein
MEIAAKMWEFEKIGGSTQYRVCSGAAHPTESADFEQLTREAYREMLIKNGAYGTDRTLGL